MIEIIILAVSEMVSTAFTNNTLGLLMTSVCIGILVSVGVHKIASQTIGIIGGGTNENQLENTTKAQAIFSINVCTIVIISATSSSIIWRRYIHL